MIIERTSAWTIGVLQATPADNEQLFRVMLHALRFDDQLASEGTPAAGSPPRPSFAQKLLAAGSDGLQWLARFVAASNAHAAARRAWLAEPQQTQLRWQAVLPPLLEVSKRVEIVGVSFALTTYTLF
jgi:hypothetical protein